MESQNIAVFVDRMVVLPIHNIGDALDVAAEPGKSKRIKVALSAGGIDGIVDGVVGNGGSDGAGDDSVQRAGTSDAAELHLGEQQLGGIVKRGDVGARQFIQNYNQDSTGFTLFASYPVRKLSFTRIGSQYGWTRTTITALHDASNLSSTQFQFRS